MNSSRSITIIFKKTPRQFKVLINIRNLFKIKQIRLLITITKLIKIRNLKRAAKQASNRNPKLIIPVEQSKKSSARSLMAP